MGPSSVILRNLPIVKQSIVALIRNTGLFVKIVCVLVIFGYGISYSEDAVDVLSVIPGYLLPPTFWLWTAFTHCFIEIRLWQVCVDIITLGLCGKLVEPLWGSFEMVLFFLLVNICVAFISALFYLILYMFTFNPDVLFMVKIQGMAGYIAGLSVAVKQIMPGHVILHTHTPLGKITNRHIPLCLFIMSLVFYLCNFLEGLYTTMIGCGIIVSWVYLRFYQVHSNGSRGDMAESFNFSSFFPTVVQPPVQVVGNGMYACLVHLRICRKQVRKYDVGAPTSISISLPGVDPQDAERRRQKALKLLSERLSQQQSDASSAWPNMEEEVRSPLLSPSQPPSTHVVTLSSSNSETFASQEETRENQSDKVKDKSDESDKVMSTVTLVNIEQDDIPVSK